MKLIIADDCSGIHASGEAIRQAGLDWQTAWMTEIEPFPNAVLKYHYPGVPNLGDMTKVDASEHGSIDLLIGGTPCQGFSVAGERGGLDDARSGLAWHFIRHAREARPRWLVWENVPGAASTSEGRDLFAIVSEFRKLGYRGGFRTLDAQYFGVPQRRRRIFFVGYLGDWRPAFAVLFERDCLQRNPPPRREARQRVAALTQSGVGTCGADDNQAQGGHLIAHPLIGGANRQADESQENYIVFQSKASASQSMNPGTLSPSIDVGKSDGLAVVTHTLRGEGFDTSEDGTGRGIPIVFMGGQGSKASMPISSDIAGTIKKATGSQVQNVMQHSSVRRLTPVECARLQGFPDYYTRIPWRGKPAEQCPDGPQYKAYGNSIAVPVLIWLFKRIDKVEHLIKARS